jgi:hypothetical protein
VDELVEQKIVLPVALLGPKFEMEKMRGKRQDLICVLLSEWVVGKRILREEFRNLYLCGT